MGHQYLTVTRAEGIALVTIADPARFNALSRELLGELMSAMEDLEADRETGVIVFTGTGKAFIAGGDIAYMAKLSSDEAIRYARETAAVYERIMSSRKDHLAAVNGYALGGGTEFALACDIRLASDKARFGFPEVKLGILPGGGGTQRLPRLIGKGKAKKLILTGDTVDAREAAKLGLVDQITGAEDLLDEAVALGRKVLRAGPLAVAYAKACIDLSEEVPLSAGFAFERNLFGLCFATQDQREGMAAFLEKREPKFNGQ